MGLWRVRHQQFRDELGETNYPFAAAATLTSTDGIVLPAGLFVDAAIHPIGGLSGAYLSSLEIDYTQITVTIGDSGTVARATGTYQLPAKVDQIPLLDFQGRPAGILISDASRLISIGTLPTGITRFSRAATEFVASVCIPTPEIGISGFLLDDGAFFSGEVYLVGGDGVVLSPEFELDPVTGLPMWIIRLDVVGDPLFRRKLCGASDHFTTPNFVRTLRIVGGSYTFDIQPDQYGDVKLSANNAEAHDTVLRVRTTSAGIVVEVAGGGATA